MRHWAVIIFLLAAWPLQAQQPYTLVLGVAQDGGYPHAGCSKACCKPAWADASKHQMVSCLALIDPQTKQSWLLDATPDFGQQLQYLRDHLHDSTHLPTGILLTHAHIGHYTGLMQLGREVMGARQMPVYAMPRMQAYLRSNGPWEQLVKLNNITLHALQDTQWTVLNEHIKVMPLLVPHRDEYSETVGFSVMLAGKRLLFIPDIDKWQKWMPQNELLRLLAAHDWCLLDGTFYREGELPGRNMREVPHPFVSESMQLFSEFTAAQKQKIYFIHLNHSNPLLWDSEAQKTFEQSGFRLARQGMELH